MQRVGMRAVVLENQFVALGGFSRAARLVMRECGLQHGGGIECGRSRRRRVRRPVHPDVVA